VGKGALERIGGGKGAAAFDVWEHRKKIHSKTGPIEDPKLSIVADVWWG
jgi:hypothetical protein